MSENRLTKEDILNKLAVLRDNSMNEYNSIIESCRNLTDRSAILLAEHRAGVYSARARAYNEAIGLVDKM